MKIELSGHYSKRRLVKSALPSIGMMVVISVYSVVDGLFISNFTGTTPFAAINLIWPAIMVVGALGLMVGAGGSALISKTMGEGDKDKADAIFSILIRTCILAGTAITVLFFAFMPAVSRWLGADGELLRLCVIYGRITVLAMPCFILQMAFQSFYMTAEKPQLGTIMSIASGLTNIILDAVFIVWLKMGLVGAALGTIAGILLGGIYPVCYFASRKNNSALHYLPRSASLRILSSKAADAKLHALRHLGKVCTNGLSEYVGNIALNIVSICYNFQLMKYLGENGVAAYGIIMYLVFVFAAVFIGYNITVSPVIGFNYGAGNTAELRSLLRKSLVLVTAAGFVLAGIVIGAARPISMIFVNYDAELLNLTVRATRIYFISFTICGINMLTSAWFTSLNNGIVSAVAAFARTLVFELGAVFAIPALLGIDCIWMAVNIAEILALGLSTALLLAFRRRYGY